MTPNLPKSQKTAFFTPVSGLQPNKIVREQLFI
jgi:hypothetical protein